MRYEGGRLSDELSALHRRWVEVQYLSGIFLASGPAEGGGVALAARCDRDELDRRLASDPVVARGAGRYEVTEFRVSLSTPGFDALVADAGGTASACSDVG